MTRDTDPTPPHGIPRPSLSPLDKARLFVTDRLSDCYEWERDGGEGSEPHPDRPELETLADLLDIAELFPSLWQAGEADTLESIVDQLAELAGARRCPSCGEMRHPDAFGGWATVCDWCREDEPDHLTPSGWERVKDAPAHPFGGAADR